MNLILLYLSNKKAKHSLVPSSQMEEFVALVCFFLAIQIEKTNNLKIYPFFLSFLLKCIFTIYSHKQSVAATVLTLKPLNHLETDKISIAVGPSFFITFFSCLTLFLSEIVTGQTDCGLLKKDM